MRKILLFALLLFARQLFAQTDSLSSDSLLLLQIQNDMKEPSAPPTIQQRIAASANPDISAIGDFRGYYRSYGKHNFDAALHETEFSFQSVVDPYARADFFYSVAEDEKTGKFSGEIEEGYLTTLSLPGHLQLKAGRFKEQMGRINPVHAHALPFIDMPDAYVNFFGEDGFKGDGLSLSWLLPNHSFFQELTVEATNVSEGPSFERSAGNNYLYNAHLKNFWDLTDNATLELGLSGMTGENLMKKITNIGAIDLTYKWKPIRYNTYKSVTFQNELYYSQAALDSSTVNAIGFYSLLNVQIAKRSFLAGRFDYSNNPYSASFVQESGSLTFGFLATEFQKIEIEGKYTTMNTALAENDNQKKFVSAYLRWIFVIGSHGAHTY
ncbi:MAG: hypothetical protein NTX97_00340 [Bacteroidetes bacterium]|nr:hypothetical protein [Bacteroidota bacterium]